MQITLQQYTHPGKRTNNEDCVMSIPDNSIFIVCDGVGGRNKGEVASKLACETILNYFENHSELMTEFSINQIIHKISDEITSIEKRNAGNEGMATTIALLQLKAQSAFVAHVGDSRVYHIRNGEIIFCTKDHSLVNEWVASGFITAEQAQFHPKKNIITRAIQSSETQIAQADTVEIQDIKENDFFFLCSDGVLETFSDELIKHYFTRENNVDFLLGSIRRICSERSDDNNSAILLRIDAF